MGNKKYGGLVQSQNDCINCLNKEKYLYCQDFEPYGILLKKYASSPYLLLSTVFPEYEWLPWKFEKLPINFWEDPKNMWKFFEWAASQLDVKSLTEWQNISRKVWR